MKKTLIATAIAGAMSFSVAAQAAPTVYGNIQLVVDATDDLYAADNGSTIGFKGEEALDNGLTAIYKAEFHAKAGTRDGNSIQANGISGTDQNYIGVKGDFGTLRVGAFDTVANDFVQDMVYVTEYAGADKSAGFVAGEHQQVQYVGDFGALTVGASVQVNKGTEANSDKQQVMQFGVKAAVAEGIMVSAALDSEDGAGVGVKASIDALTVGARFETSDSEDAAISASVAMDHSAGNVYGVFGTADTADSTDFLLGATYNLSSNLYTFAEFADGDANDSVLAFGAVMSF